MIKTITTVNIFSPKYLPIQIYKLQNITMNSATRDQSTNLYLSYSNQTTVVYWQKCKKKLFTSWNVKATTFNESTNLEEKQAVYFT